jgi:hypothetical protein
MGKEDEKLVLQFIPVLVVILKAKEDEKGSPLSEKEVLNIRDMAVCISLPINAAMELEKSRGYSDIDPENCWHEWCEIRKQFQKTD